MQGVNEDYPLSPKASGFLHGVHEHTKATVLWSGLMLGLGCHVPFLRCADDVALLPDPCWGS